MKKILIIIIMITCFNLSLVAKFNEGVGIGPLYGFSGDNKIIGLDLSYTKIPATLSLQPRFLFDKTLIDYGLDTEISVWFLLNIGLGIGYYDESEIVYHLFLGLPLGDLSGYLSFSKYLVTYIEPYYRYNYHNSNGSHEFGIMIKVNTLNFHPDYDPWSN